LARKILLADDSVTAQNMGRKILADAGYEVVTVNNGSAALKRVAELKPDLIVLDVYMPGYSGLEVCQRLKDAGETARIPVLLTVGKLEPFKVEEARRVRADAHIVKPFEASELLATIARLWDRAAAQPPPEKDVPADTGWTSRLSFPSKKKKDVEPEDVAAGAAFRDFRKSKSKTGVGGAVPAKAASPAQDPGVAPEIPQDITPEELDALSELAAKLDGPAAAAENAALPLPQQVEAAAPEIETEAELDVAPVVEPAIETAADIEPNIEPAMEPAAESVHAAFAVEPATLAVEGKNEFEIPVESVEPAIENAPLVALQTASAAEEAAPVDRSVDRNDEPMFASAAGAVEPAEKEMAGEPSEAEEPAPNDTELAEALRLLTPATGHAEASTVPSHETLVAAGQLLAEEAAHNAATSPRWMAEAVALSPEEAAISLEAEMFRTFAAMPAAMPEGMHESYSGAELVAASGGSVAAIAAAVENRLAEAGLAASSTAVAGGAENGSETATQEVAGVSQAASLVDAAEAEKTESQDSPAPVMEQVVAEESVAVAEEAPKAMAAAAAADGAASASDAIAIANIVDSVLADLRPKLLEQIAKKMAGK
jgi:CheY-like chemotaxis protein